MCPVGSLSLSLFICALLLFVVVIYQSRIVSAIKRLARNDANKKLLVQLDALQLLVKLANGSVEEQIGMLDHNLEYTERKN